MSEEFTIGARDFTNGVCRLPEGVSFFGLSEADKYYFEGWTWAKARHAKL